MLTGQIPIGNLPGQSFSKGFSTIEELFKNMHAYQMEQQKLAELMKYHGADVGLRRQAAGRAAALQPLQMSLLQQKIAHQKQLNDPNFKVQQLLRTLQALKGMEGGGKKLPETGASYIPGIGKQGQAKNQNLEDLFKPLFSGQGMSRIQEGQEGMRVPEMMPGQKQGLIAPGNIDLNNRPVVKNPQGGMSTVLTMGISEDGKHINIPRISDDGRILNEKEAIDQFHKTGKHLGVYESQSAADNAAQQLHQDQAQQYGLNDQQQNIPSLNENAISPFESMKSGSPGMWLPKGITLEDIARQVLDLPGRKQGSSVEDQLELYKAKRDYDIEHPKASTSGITAEDRERDREIKKAQLDELIQHHRKLEETASTEEKVKLAKQRNDLEVEKKKLEAENKVETDYKTGLDKENAKTYGAMQNQAIKGVEEQPVLDGLADTLSDAGAKQVLSHPYLGKYSLKYYKNSGDPNLAKTAANLELYGNKIVAATAKGLNSRFTNMDLQLAKNMKISDEDSFESAMAKAQSLIYLEKLGNQRREKALDIIREKRVTPIEAIKMADASINGNKLRDEITKQLHANEEMIQIEDENGNKEWVTEAEAKRRGA